MKLSDLALSDEPKPPESGDGDEGEDAGGDPFGESATKAFELWDKGDKSGAMSALKGAIEACVADYMADE